jgi:hypothetical protein
MKTAASIFGKTPFQVWADARKGQHDAHLARYLRDRADRSYVGSWGIYAVLKAKAEVIDPSVRWYTGSAG